MYLNHFGLSETPFRITPHTDFFFAGANRGETLEALVYAITHDEGIIKVTGEVGSGKTMLCRVLMERLPSNVETVYLANPSLGRDEILLAILDDLKFPVPGERQNLLLRTLQEHLISLYASGKRVVLLIDEAHAMPAETLEQIRLLSNLETSRHKLLQIVLFAQQELDDMLQLPQMRPLRERITHSFSLEPLVHADVGTYIIFRMRQAGYKGPDPFNAAAIKRLSKASLGLTRRINILADKALLAAFTLGEHGITAKHVGIAEKDSDFGSLGKRQARTPTDHRRQLWLGMLAAAAIVITLLGIGIFIGQWRGAEKATAAAKGQTPPAPAPAKPDPSPESTATPGVIGLAAGTISSGGAVSAGAPAIAPGSGYKGGTPATAATPTPAAASAPATPPQPIAPSGSGPVESRIQTPTKKEPEIPAKPVVAPAKTTDAQPKPREQTNAAEAAKATVVPKGRETKGAAALELRPKATEEGKSSLPSGSIASSQVAQTPAEKSAEKPAPKSVQAKPAAPSWLNIAPMTLLEGRIKATPGWLAQAPKGAHTLQLMSNSPAYMGEFDRWIDAARAEIDLQKLYAFSSRTGSGGHRVSIVYGQYTSRDAARTAVASLPDRVRNLNPSPRTISGIKSEIQNQK